jgi:hypothetical protein
MLVSPGKVGAAFASRCNSQVEFYLFRNVGRMEIENLKLSSFCVIYNWIDGQLAKCWMFHAFATRLLKGRHYNWDIGGPFVEQESARRLAWHTFVSIRSRL